MGKKVLVVEDYSDSRGFMKALIEGLGHTVIEASDGEEAISMAKYGHPDLILMDLAMPVMNGLATTRVIRGFEDGMMPIIAVSAYGDDYYAQAIAAGCNDLLTKPVDASRLESVLDKYLSH